MFTNQDVSMKQTLACDVKGRRINSLWSVFLYFLLHHILDIKYLSCLLVRGRGGGGGGEWSVLYELFVINVTLTTNVKNIFC